MMRRLAGMLLLGWLSVQSHAGDRISVAQIQQVIDATDAAARNRDAETIGSYLSDSFEKVIEFTHDRYLATVTLDRDQYLALIDDGWTSTESYDYRREATVIHILPDGSRGQSFSTVIELVTRDGREMVSRFREHALYTLEDGRAVITRISGHTLVGDTTPGPR